MYYGTSKIGRPPAEFEVKYKIIVEDIDIANKRVKQHQIGTLIRKGLLGSKKLTESDETGWIEIGKMEMISKTPYIVEEEYEGQLHLESIGERKCVIQQYGIPSSLSKGIVFWDKEFIWPLQYINIFRRLSERPGVLHIAKECADMILNFPDLNLQTSLKQSRNVILREDSIVVSLKETNIPFVIPRAQP